MKKGHHKHIVHGVDGDFLEEDEEEVIDPSIQQIERIAKDADVDLQKTMT